jgi:hypothetical protein
VNIVHGNLKSETSTKLCVHEFGFRSPVSPCTYIATQCNPVLWIRIGFNANPDPGSEIFFIIKKYNSFIPRPPGKMIKLQNKRSVLQREHPALKNMKFLHFLLFLWVIFAFWIRIQPNIINAGPCGSGSTTLIYSQRSWRASL